MMNNYSYAIDINNDELRKIKNFIGSQNTVLNKTITEFIRKNTNKSKRDCDKIIEGLNTAFRPHDYTFIKNYIYNMVYIFPEYILNKSRKIGKIPKHWNLSNVTIVIYIILLRLIIVVLAVLNI